MKLALGTAQFGLDYGVVNRAGQLTQEQSGDVIGLARLNGIDTLDTAIAYGNSETALGKLGVRDFRIVTKLPGIDPLATDPERWVMDQVAGSLERLQVGSVYGLLLHRPADLTGSHGKALLAALAALKDKGWCEKVGVSIYRPGQLDEIWPHYRPDIVQCSYSILDRRLETSGWAERLQAENVELHLRSIFLQGLSLMAPEQLPVKFSKWKPEFEAIANWSAQNGISQAEAAIGCALALSSADRVVVGVDGVAQLEELIAAGKKGGIAIPMQFACDDQDLIDPNPMVNGLDTQSRSVFRLGVIGMSEGNGHPYSWSAICNGYDSDAMRACPFPAIPKYLDEHEFPDDFIQDAQVTHIWCNDRLQAEHIASAARIETVVDHPEAMIGQVDGILLARDDARNHWRFASPFLRAGLPVYIDKPLAVTADDAERLLTLDPEGHSLFSCSALRYADELMLGPDEMEAIGDIRMIDAWAPKYWETYAVHVIEPLIAQFPMLRDIAAHEVREQDGVTQLVVTWLNGIVTRFTTYGAQPSAIGFKVQGTIGECEKTFSDSFGAFKKALEHFIGVARDGEANIPRQQTRKIVEIIVMAGSHEKARK